MIIKANYEEMLNTEIKLKEQSNKVNKEVDNLLSLLNDIKRSWDGNDSNIFVGKANAYFLNIKQISESINDFASFIKYASVVYEQRDLKWKKEVQEAGVNFGDEEFKHQG